MTLLAATHLQKRFPVGKGRKLHAVDDVSFSIPSGGSLGLVGESGSGKSTVARLVTKLLTPDGGMLQFEGRDIGAMTPRQFAGDPARRSIQLVFQNADDALNPALTAERNIAIGGGGRASTSEVAVAAAAAGIAAELLKRRPHQLSGGQQARVGIARALLPNPKLLVLDEPTASLDVSVQATVLKLIESLRRKRGISLLFVSHDLEVVRLMCDEVMVLYLGRVAEIGPVGKLLTTPAHPYTRALLAATPGKVAAPPLAGEPLSPIDPPQNACLFHSRCPLATDRCRSERPMPRNMGEGWKVACHRAGETA